MTTDKTHKGFEEFSIELAKHPVLYERLLEDEVVTDLKDLRKGIITSAKFSEKYYDERQLNICNAVFEYIPHEVFSMEMIPDSPMGGGWFGILELFGFYYTDMEECECEGPFKKFDDAVTASFFGEIIENMDMEWTTDEKNRLEIKYDKHFERYFDSHIKHVIVACCRNSISGNIDVNGVAYREVNGEVKASS